MLRKLGQAEYGLFSLVNTTISYLTILDFGFGNAIVRYTAKFRAEKNTEREEMLHGMFFLLYLGIGLLAFALSLLLVLNTDRLFSRSFSDDERATARVLMWLAAANVAMAFPFSVFASSITAHERFTFSKGLSLLQLVTNPLLMVAVLALGYRSTGMVAATTLLNLAFNFWKFFYWKYRLGLRMRFSRFDTQLLHEIAGYSFFVFLNLIVDRIYWSSGQFLLGIFVNARAVSVFAIGMQMVNRFYLPMSTAMAGLFLPKVTMVTVREISNTKLSEMFVKVGRLQFIILALVLSGFIMYGAPFIRQWAGEEYRDSYVVAVVVMIPLLVPLTQSLGISILQARNRHRFRSMTYLIIALANIAISIPLAKLWGAVGCAVATSISMVVGQIITMNIYYHRLGLAIARYWIEMARMMPAVLIPCALAYALAKILSPDSHAGLLVNCTAFAAMYSISMVCIGLNRYERELVVQPVRALYARLRPARSET